MTAPGREHIRWFRNTAPYINAHRGKTFVLMLGGAAARHENFPNVIHDIALLNSLGVRLVIIHGSREQIDQRLAAANINSRFHEGLRVTDNDALEHVKDAAGSLRAQIEALLSMGLPNSPMQGSRMRVCSGNFVTARPIGVVDGIDFHHTGRVRRVDTEGIRRQLEDGSIVLQSPLGYSPTGEIFNLSLDDIAVQLAAAIGADKLLLFGRSAGVMDVRGELVRQCAVGSSYGRNPADGHTGGAWLASPSKRVGKSSSRLEPAALEVRLCVKAAAVALVRDTVAPTAAYTNLGINAAAQQPPGDPPII